MTDPIYDALDAHFVTMHLYDDPAKPPGEWICSCGKKFGFSDSVVEHQAAMVREAVRRADRRRSPATDRLTDSEWAEISTYDNGAYVCRHEGDCPRVPCPLKVDDLRIAVARILTAREGRIVARERAQKAATNRRSTYICP